MGLFEKKEGGSEILQWLDLIGFKLMDEYLRKKTGAVNFNSGWK